MWGYYQTYGGNLNVLSFFWLYVTTMMAEYSQILQYLVESLATIPIQWSKQQRETFKQNTGQLEEERKKERKKDAENWFVCYRRVGVDTTMIKTDFNQRENKGNRCGAKNTAAGAARHNKRTYQYYEHKGLLLLCILDEPSPSCR